MLNKVCTYESLVGRGAPFFFLLFHFRLLPNVEQLPENTMNADPATLSISELMALAGCADWLFMEV